MPMSRARRLRRMQLCVNRKLTAVRWMGSMTVGVICRSGNNPTAQLKANERAERSLLVRKRRRGRRKGKKRSRGCHPRSNSPLPTRNVNEPSNRVLTSHLRACDYWYDKVEYFGKLFKRSKIYTDRKVSDMAVYRVWKTRWKSLHNHINRCGEGVMWCSRIGSSFSYYLEQQFGIILDRREQLIPVTARSVLSDWAESRRIRQYLSDYPRSGNRSQRARQTPSRRIVPDHCPYQVVRGRTATCSWCGYPAFAWGNHRCFLDWQRSERQRRTGGHRRAL
jgi:hypothetical protein